MIMAISGPFVCTQKEITSQTDEYVVILSSKTYVFEDKLVLVSSTNLIFLSVQLLPSQKEKIHLVFLLSGQAYVPMCVPICVLKYVFVCVQRYSIPNFLRSIFSVGEKWL